MNILRIIYDFADLSVNSDGLSPGPYELTIAQGNYKDNKIFVLTGNLNGKNLKQKKFVYTLCNRNVVVYNLPRAIKGFGPFLTSSLFVLPFYFYIKIRYGIDIIHNHQQMGIWLLLYKKLFGFIDKTPLIHTNHGPILIRERKIKEQNTHQSFLAKYFEYPLHKLSDKLSMNVSDAVIAVSTNVKEELESNYKTSVPIYVVENGVNIAKFTNKGLVADLGFSKDSVIICNGGRLSKRKNIDLLVESLTHLDSKYVLALWGSWDSSLELKVKEIIKTNKLENRIKFLGSISYWEIDKYYRACEIFVLPSIHEGLPKVVLESLSCGNKVIASGFHLDHSIPNLEYLDEIQPEYIAEKIKMVYKRSNNYECTKEIIDKFYSWNTKVQEIDKIYKKYIKK